MPTFSIGLLVFLKIFNSVLHTMEISPLSVEWANNFSVFWLLILPKFFFWYYFYAVELVDLFLFYDIWTMNHSWKGLSYTKVIKKFPISYRSFLSYFKPLIHLELSWCIVWKWGIQLYIFFFLESHSVEIYKHRLIVDSCDHINFQTSSWFG